IRRRPAGLGLEARAAARRAGALGPQFRVARRGKSRKGMRVGIDLSTRVAIVTGAGGGLGAAHAIALAKRGAKLVVADMNGEAAASVAAQIEAAGGEAMPAAVSV